jgi:hypothetical protein
MRIMHKLEPLPKGEAAIGLAWHGTAISAPDAEPEHIVYLGIGRPVMGETEDGELVAVFPMPLKVALDLGADLLHQCSRVQCHIEGQEDCGDHV